MGGSLYGLSEYILNVMYHWKVASQPPGKCCCTLHIPWVYGDPFCIIYITIFMFLWVYAALFYLHIHQCTYVYHDYMLLYFAYILMFLCFLSICSMLHILQCSYVSLSICCFILHVHLQCPYVLEYLLLHVAYRLILLFSLSICYSTFICTNVLQYASLTIRCSTLHINQCS
mgnify:CR=1 FL=1